MSAIARGFAANAAVRTDKVSPALERLLTRYQNVVKAAVRRCNLSESDVDELIQEVRIRLWRALSSSEKINGVPASYVYRTAVTAAVDLIRRRRARRENRIDESTDPFPASSPVLPDLDLEASELASQLGRALGMLQESRRVVVRMHLAGYHRDEISKLLGWTEAKTRNLLYRGLADLKARLAERWLQAGTGTNA